MQGLEFRSLKSNKRDKQSMEAGRAKEGFVLFVEKTKKRGGRRRTEAKQDGAKKKSKADRTLRFAAKGGNQRWCKRAMGDWDDGAAKVLMRPASRTFLRRLCHIVDCRKPAMPARAS